MARHQHQFSIQVNEEVRVARLNASNWAIQVVPRGDGEEGDAGERWVTRGYYPRLDDALAALARRLLEDRLSEGVKMHVQDARARFAELSDQVLDELQRARFAVLRAGEDAA